MPYPVGPDSAYPDEVPYGQDQAGITYYSLLFIEK